MSRPLRIEWPGALYHVTSRGDRREPIVEDDVDRRAWVEVLGQACERFNWRVHAWCLMTNHYHVVVETPEGNLSSGVRHLNGVWSQRFNRRHGRVGHVFQGRFKAILVQRQGYLLELARYVVLNPVRAGMVARAADYAWSSYAGTLAAALGHAPSADHWFQPGWLLSQLGSEPAAAARAYADFVSAGVGQPSVWQQLRHEIYLGSAEFVRQMQAQIKSGQALQGVPVLQQRPPRLPLSHWQERFPRNQGLALAFASGHWKQAEIAAHFGVSVPTVSRAVASVKAEAAGATHFTARRAGDGERSALRAGVHLGHADLRRHRRSVGVPLTGPPVVAAEQHEHGRFHLFHRRRLDALWRWRLFHDACGLQGDLRGHVVGENHA